MNCLGSPAQAVKQTLNDANFKELAAKAVAKGKANDITAEAETTPTASTSPVVSVPYDKATTKGATEAVAAFLILSSAAVAVAAAAGGDFVAFHSLMCM